MRALRRTFGAFGISLGSALFFSAIAAGMPQLFDTVRNRFSRALGGETLVASGSRATGNSGSLGVAPIVVNFQVVVTVAGTTLAVTLEESDDGSTWAAVGAAVNQNGVGTSAMAYRTVQRRFYRFSWAITGANYTFSITGDTKG